MVFTESFLKMMPCRHVGLFKAPNACTFYRIHTKSHQTYQTKLIKIIIKVNEQISIQHRYHVSTMFFFQNLEATTKPMWPRLARRSLASIGSADVAIVGAGPSGLAACKAALEEIFQWWKTGGNKKR